ncbi:MAG TPA: SRPBCC family protein [Gemmatimonadales bacterium]|nr:SRPBCC family protein [Gemmatimonadales bacterium]
MATELASRGGAIGYEDFDHGRMPDRRRDGDSHSGTRPRQDNAEQLARFLGWFSIGLGLAEVAAPGQLARMIGVENKPGLFRLMGLREIGSGVAILSRDRPANAVWARVAGDILDLALLGTQLDGNNQERQKTLAATMAVLGVTALDIYTARSLSESNGDGRPISGTIESARDIAESSRGIKVKTSVTVSRAVAEVYGFWRNFENLPRFMTHLESVQVLSDRRSRWIAVAPAGKQLEWEAEMLEDRPNELISWRSLPGAQVDTAGYVRFRPAPGEQGTEIVVEMRYDPPGGMMAAAIAKLFGESGQDVVTRDLRAFKNVVELGEVVHSDSSMYTRPHPARPSSEEELGAARLLRTEGAR